MEYREEEDTLGKVKVPEDKLFGAQTERSKENFLVGSEKMPIEVIHSLALIKKSSAIVNCKLKLISKEKRDVIVKAADEVLTGRHDSHFPLVVWQTGSGTQTNMNVNEVIANLANECMGGKRGEYNFIHPNDDVNKSQSSNDVVPSACCIAVAMLTEKKLIPALLYLKKHMDEKVKKFEEVIKCGRTHMMDATPLSLGQEFSGFSQQIKHAIAKIEVSYKNVCFLALGGTAVGTGLNSHKKYAEKVAKEISSQTKVKFHTAENKFEALGSMDSLVSLSGELKALACAFMKIGNDIRMLGSGPRCGLGELILPANEPGSSIMPGKVNPTQCEMITQVACQVMGNDVAITIAGASGHLQLNVFRPVVVYNLLQSIHLLSDAARNFTDKCLVGIEPNKEVIEKHLHDSLMLVTALNPHIGYENAAKIAKKAYTESITLKDAAVRLRILTPEEFTKLVDPKSMIQPN